METIITIKIAGINVDFEFDYNEYTWSLYCKSEELDFTGSAFNGHYNYNRKKVISYIDAKEFSFFRNLLESKMEVILRKSKILKK